MSHTKFNRPSGIYPEGLTHHIREISPLYIDLSPDEIGFLASIVFVNYFHPARFRHLTGNGFFVYSKAAERKLGRDYPALLKPIVKRDPQYREGICKQANLTATAVNAVERYLDERKICIMFENGKPIMPTGKVQSRDTQGNNAMAKFRMQPATPGSSEDVFRLVRFISESINGLVGWSDHPKDAEAFRWMIRHGIDPTNPDNLEKLQAIRDQGKVIIDMANSRYFPSNGILSIPVETSTGRIIYKSPSLQNTRKVIRDCYLAGFFDVDIQAAHTTFAHHAAQSEGIDVPNLKHYIAHKNAVRRTIAEKTGITIDTVKQAILAVSYGARVAIREGSAIYDMIREESSHAAELCQALFDNELFSGIAADLRKTQTAVIRQYLKPGKKGYCKNAIGKPIIASERKATLAAHALQGLEAKFLHIAYGQIGTDILLMMHDGIVTRHPIKLEPLQAEFEAETGIKITLEQRQLPAISEA